MDVQALGVAFAAVFAALAPLILGLKSGKASRTNDQNKAKLEVDNARFAREQAEEVVSRERVLAFAADAAAARARVREVEMQFDADTRELRADRQRGWDLARHHYGLMSFLAHLISNMLQIVADDPPAERYVATVRAVARRMDGVNIPETLEAPIPRSPGGTKAAGD